MITHTKLKLPQGNDRATNQARAAALQTAIIEHLAKHGRSTAVQMAARFDVKNDRVRTQLITLERDGDVRRRPRNDIELVTTTGVIWELGNGEATVHVENTGARLTRAQQTGSAARDWLVAAFFGPAAGQSIAHVGGA